MSTPGPFGLPFFDDLMKLFTTDGPVNWDIARQLAQMSASGGAPETNVDPIDRIRLEELVRVADLHVSDATGLATSITGGVLTVRPVSRAEWALTALDHWKPLLEGLATSLGRAANPTTVDEPGTPADPSTGLLGDLGAVIGPLFMSFQIGGLAGHLAQRALGQYDPPLPRPRSDELLVVPAAIDQFASDWSLPVDDMRLWLLIHEISYHAVLGRPHVGDRLQALLLEYVSGFDPDPTGLEDKLGAFDPMRPESIQEAMGDPEALLGAVQTQAQRDLLVQIDALTAAIFGFVDHTMDTVGRKLISSYGPLTEALRRRRVEEDEATRMLGRLLGLELRQSQFERGNAFVRGVVERAGEDGLNRLWRSERDLPTPAEIDAPGLWLARIELPD
ncbi:MAG: hypothetical protein QOG64_3283 [Acidimicrobiaceae bacterium]|nr:hypothetical protein [Acidimicrobiaceae bacterium]